jgi:hypothetical protein
VPLAPVAHPPAACAAVIRALPHEIGAGVIARRTAPASTSTAAWGDPPITFRCGVPAGNPADDIYTFNGVEWAMHDTGASRTWTTVSRAVDVVVMIPDEYDDQASKLGILAVALRPTRR